MGIGDELIVTGQVRIMRQRDPRKVRITYERPRWHEVWDNNPNIALPGEVGDFQELKPRHEWRRPYIAAKTKDVWTWQRWPDEWGGACPRGEMYFTDAEKEYGEAHAGLVLIEPGLKAGASPNKNWGIGRWTDLARLLKAEGVPVARMGATPADRIGGVEYVHTRTMREASAVIANARLVITHEGACHHAAAAVRTPAVVLYGGYISPLITGYQDQRNLYVDNPHYPLGCGSRMPCAHCANAMNEFSVKKVASIVFEMMQSAVA